MTKTFKITIIILILTALAVGGVVGVSQNNAKRKAQSEKEMINNNENEAEEAITDETMDEIEEITPDQNIDTSNWKTYRNEEYGFELKYPEEWYIIEMTKSESSCFSVFCVFFKTAPEDSISTIKVSDRSTESELKKEEEMREFLFRKDGVSKPISKKKIKIDNEIGTGLTFRNTYLEKKEGRILDSTTIFAGHDRYTYILGGFHKDSSDPQSWPISSNMIATFRFLN